MVLSRINSNPKTYHQLQAHSSPMHYHNHPFLLAVLKPRSRKQRSLFCLVFIVIIQICFVLIYRTTAANFKQFALIQVPSETRATGSAQYYYDHLIDVFQQQDFISKPFHVKASLYFDSLYKFNPNWSITTLQNLKYYKKLSQESDFKNYYKRECENEWTRLNVKDREERTKICSVVRSTILSNWKQNKFIENEIFNYMGHLKIFNQAYIKNQLPYLDQFKDLESRLFPFLTGVLPIYRNHNDDTYTAALPDLTNSPNSEPTTQYGDNENNNMMMIQYLLKSYNGQGIVFTTSDSHAQDTIRTIKVLRFLQNRLPIQIVYKNAELSADSQEAIIEAARGDTESHRQDVWFVDVTPSIKPEYNDHFNKFSMKFLATIFNSFEEMVFLDNDAVPFVSPQEFLQEVEYQSKGVFFFKDRNFKNRGLNQQNLNFYKRLLPSHQFDFKFFQIPTVRDDPDLGKNFFKGLSKHYVDSGLFMMNKQTHLGGVLAALHLSTWTPTSAFVYGDKELFWLAQLMVGNDVAFSPNFASVSGKIESYSTSTNQVCSSQLTHLSAPAAAAAAKQQQPQILWVNGGLRYCNQKPPQLDTESELGLYKGVFKDTASLQAYYDTPVKLEAAVIPAQDLAEYTNADAEPVKNWEPAPQLGCNNRVFCSFDKFGPRDAPVLNTLVRFDEAQVARYNDIISAWTKN